MTLHFDDSIDSKSLLGSYIAGETPGEFRWVPGVLSRAVAAGQWVLIEDIDLAPAEVVAALLPLVEDRRLVLPGSGAVLEAARGFHLFGSVTYVGGRGSRGGGDALGGGRWARAVMEHPGGAEQGAILGGLFPQIAPLVPGMLSTLAAARAVCGQARPGDAALASSVPSTSSPVPLVPPSSAQEGSAVQNAQLAERTGPAVNAGRVFSLRDLVKWGHRIATLQASELHAVSGRTGAPSREP